MRAEDRRRAADHVLIVSVEHPRVYGEGLGEQHAMPTRISEFQRPAMGDRRERDKVSKTCQRRHIAKNRWRGRAEDQDRGLELLSEIVREAVEEASERGMRPFEGRNARVFGGRERGDLTADGSFQRNIRQDEYRRPIGSSHVLFLSRRQTSAVAEVFLFTICWNNNERHQAGRQGRESRERRPGAVGGSRTRRREDIR